MRRTYLTTKKNITAKVLTKGKMLRKVLRTIRQMRPNAKSVHVNENEVPRLTKLQTRLVMI